MNTIFSANEKFCRTKSLVEKQFRVSLLFSWILLITTQAGVVLAKDKGAMKELKQRKGSLLEEVFVTAQKRKEDASDVPISITALSGDQMEALGIEEANDLSAVVPSLQMTESVGFSVVYLRGVGTDAFLMADPSVAMYIDDVYMPHAFGASQHFGKVESVEVLKGPQGTIFGRNATGGAINVHTKKPSPEEYEVSIGLERADYNRNLKKGFVNIPIGDSLALSASRYKIEQDSYYDAVQNVSQSNPAGDKVPGKDADGYQIKGFYEFGDKFDVLIMASKTTESDPGTLLGTNTQPSTLGQTLGIPKQEGRKNIKISGAAVRETEIDVKAATIKFYPEWFDIKLIASRQNVLGNNQIDIDGSTQPIFGFVLDKSFADVDQAELQLTSNGSSWNSESMKWIFGIYYYNSVAGVQPSHAIVGDTNLGNNVVFGVPLPADVVGQLSGSLSPASLQLASGQPVFDGIVGTKSLAQYAQISYDFTDWFAFTLGGRYQNERRELIDSRAYLANADGSRGQLTNDARGLPPTATKKFTPRVALEFRPADDHLIYMQWQKAIKSATFNAINLIDEAELVNAEEIKAYEIGIKSSFLDGQVQLTSAVFDYDITDIQVQFFSVQAGGAITFENAERARTKGFDFDLRALLVPSLIDELYLTASGAYLDAKFEKFDNCTGYDESSGAYTEGLDCTGNDVTRSPKLSGRLGLNKIFSFGNNMIEIAGDVYYNSGFYNESNNRSSTEQEEYKIYNAHITYRYEPFGVSLTAYGRNLEDEQYAISSFGTDFGNLISLAAPRVYGFQLGWDYAF